MAAKTKAPAKKKPEPIHPLMVNRQAWDKQKVMDIVCNAIATSAKSISTILGQGFNGVTLPDYATFARWLGEPGADALRDQYARAKDAQADFMGEEMIELHAKAWVPVLNSDGLPIMVNDKPLMTVDKASAALVRLEAENKKWLMGKLKPKKYGDRTTLAGDAENPLAVLTMEQITTNPASRIKV